MGMAQELFVDLHYQGIELGRRLQFESVVATGAYLHSPAPMPVGTVLTIDADDELELTVRVTRVSEQVAGTERPAGMFVEPYELSGPAQDRWNSWAEGAGTPTSATADPDVHAVDEGSSAGAEPEASPPEQAAAADEEPPAKEKGKAKKKRSRRKKAKS